MPAKSSARFRRPKDPTRGRLATAGANRHEQSIEIGNPQRCPGTGDGANACKLPKLVAASLHDVNGALSTTDVEVLPSRVEENIVRIAAGRHSCGHIAGAGIE